MNIGNALASQIERHRADWPDDLTRKALFAVNALKFTDERKPAAVKLRAKDLKAFADGYEAWAALTNSERESQSFQRRRQSKNGQRTG